MENPLIELKEKVQNKMYGVKEKVEEEEKPTASVNTEQLQIEPSETPTEESKEEPKQSQIIQVTKPVFLNQSDKDLMLYNTHLMVKEIYEFISKR